MSKREVERLEEMLADLEATAGLNPTHEVITQRDNGTWPEPTSDAEVVIERVRFAPTHVVVVNKRPNEAALVEEIEADARLNKSRAAIDARRAK